MKPTTITKDQWLEILKATLYVGVSASLDYLIALSTGSQFGPLTPVINIILVTVKKLFTSDKGVA